MQEKRRILSFNYDTDFIKLIAISAMLADHVGKIFYKEVVILQIVGRISFPLFAYCLSVGAVHTRDIKKYMLRLAVFAFVTQPLYIMAFLPNLRDFYAFALTCFYSKNIMFTLLLGLVCIYWYKEKAWPLLAFGLLFAQIGHFDYGIYGVLLILAFYVFRDNIYKSLGIVAIIIGTQFIIKSNLELFGITMGMNGFGLIGLPFAYFETKTNIRINKYFFYIFYPAHLFAIYLIQVL